jgi:hypothetical protein
MWAIIDSIICSFADNVELNLPDYLIFFLKRKRKRKVWAELVEQHSSKNGN